MPSLAGTALTGWPATTALAVVTVAPQTAPLSVELPGRVEASRVAQVRARVNGIVLKRLFREGSEVKAGQLLFQIDPAPYQAAVDSAKAALAKAQANLTQAKELATRYKPLADARAISSQEYVNAQAAQAQAEADVASANAALRTAQLNLGYASVTAPISGRIGRALVTEGALVGQGEAIKVGTPLVAGAKVEGEVLSHGRGTKLIVYKFRKRSNYRKKQGHRQAYTEIKITGIQG